MVFAWSGFLRQIQSSVGTTACARSKIKFQNTKMDDDGALSIKKLLRLIGLTVKSKFRDFFSVTPVAARFEGRFHF
jgi:hypothetical protein